MILNNHFQGGATRKSNCIAMCQLFRSLQILISFSARQEFQKSDKNWLSWAIAVNYVFIDKNFTLVLHLLANVGPHVF